MSIIFSGLFGGVIGAAVSHVAEVGLWSGILAGGLSALTVHWVMNARESTRLGGIISYLWLLPPARRQLVADQNELDSFEIEYIHHIRTRSYETEIIITIGFFAALFSIEYTEIDDALWTLSKVLPPAVLLVVSKASFFALWLVRLGMVIHLILRSMWIALVGLSSTYPRGVNNTFLRSALEQRMYRHLTSPDTGSRLTLKIERMCNLVYAIWLSCLFSLLTWAMFLVVSYGAAHTLSQGFRSILPSYGSVFDSSLYLPIFSLVLALIMFAIWTHFKVSQISRIAVLRYPIVDIVQFFRGVFLTHTPWLRLLVVIFPLLCFSAGSLSQGDTTDYTYTDRLPKGKILSIPAISTGVIEFDYVEVYLPQKYLAKIGMAGLLVESPQIGGAPLEGASKDASLDAVVGRHFSLYIDSSRLEEIQWMVVRLGDVPVLFTVASVAGIEDGPHALTIEQKVAHKEARRLTIPFYRIAP